MRLISAIPLFFLSFAAATNGQTISLIAEGAVTRGISVNGRIFTDSANIEYQKGNPLVFDFSRVSHPKALIVIKYATQSASIATGAFITIDSNFLAGASSIQTDKNWTITLNGQRMDLKNPFMVYLGFYGDSKKITSLKINPVTRLAGGVSSNNTAQTGSPPGDQKSEPAYQPGSAIRDALKLADSKHLHQTEVRAIAKIYFPDVEISDYETARLKLDSAAHLRIRDKIKAEIEDVTITGQGGEGGISALSASGIGGLDVTNLVDGLAKFYVKRVKQELAITLFEKMNREMDKRPPLKLLFPQTAELLRAAGTEIYEYERYIQNIRASVKNDLTGLPENIPDLVDHYEDSYFKWHAYEEAMIRSGCYIARELMKKTHPADLLANYPVDYLNNLPEKRELKASLQLLQALSNSFRDTAKGDAAPYWVSIGSIRELIQDKRAFKIYLGLLTRQIKNNFGKIEFSPGFELTEKLGLLNASIDNTLADFNACKNFILQLGAKTDALNKVIAGYRESESPPVEKITSYVNAVVDLLQYCTSVQKINFSGVTWPASTFKSFEPYFDMAYTITGMVTDVTGKNYSGAINRAIHLYELSGLPRYDWMIKKMDWATHNQTVYTSLGLVDAGSMRQLDAFVLGATIDTTALNTLAKQLFEKKLITRQLRFALKSGEELIVSMAEDETKQVLIKYGSLIATIAAAQNSNQVEEAIEAAALPVGSARIKRNSSFNVSLNGYVGLFAGYEKTSGDAIKFQFNTAGLTAPLGVAVNWGHHFLFCPTAKAWSTSLYFSLIDIGTVAAFRFGDGSSAVPAIQLRNILSPGMFLSLGIPSTPLSINIGSQMGPSLRKISAGVTAPDISDKLYWRHSISFCVDIPILNLYTRPK